MSPIIHLISIIIITVFFLNVVAVNSNGDESFDILNFHGDYSPPSPPPPPTPPYPPTLSCVDDLQGIGSLNSTCELTSSLNFSKDIYIGGNGSLRIHSGVVLGCPISGCVITINLTDYFSLGENSTIIAGTVMINATNATFGDNSMVNVTGLAGEAPAQTSGRPSGVQGAGGGHGGRGASCVTDNKESPEDVWGGDAYSWLELDRPWSYGSKGGTTSKEEDYGGEGGGRIGLFIDGLIEFGGSLLANGADGGIKGGGGSGGSIHIKASRMTGSGKVSATGGDGFAGGGGGRISINVFSRHDDSQFLVHGGKSLGCPENAGAAGTYYDAVPRSLIICNHNMSTSTDTLLLEFPKQPLWTNVYVQNHAKASVPLFWSRVQVRGQIHLSCAAVLSFGLSHYSSSEFELMAEELLMSDSVIKIYGALRMSVKMHLMWNSKMLIDGGTDVVVETSLLEASNLVVLRESSVIHSNANLGVHGQGYLNLSGPGDVIEAQRLVLSLFVGINLGQGSILRGPLVDGSDNDTTPRLYCDRQDCPVELLHPPEDCNVNSSLSFTLQICRVEDLNAEGIITGSVVHFHLVRTVVVHSTGEISASGLGCVGGVGKGKVLDSGVGGGGGHGGKGGYGFYDGNSVEGGIAYGNPNLPCELGSGSGDDSLAGSTAGGGIIVMGSLEHSLSSLSVHGLIRADGESFGDMKKQNGDTNSNIGPGGGAGGTILLFVHSLTLGISSTVSTVGGHGSSSGGGGGGGGRVHFHWSKIPTGDEYFPLAIVNGSIDTRGGFGSGQAHAGENGTLTGRACPKGLYGIYCEECPVGTYKNVSGSDKALCRICPSTELPHRAEYITVRGGVAHSPCPYQCISDRYHMPNCYTAFEELVYTFGGPWLFGIILLGLLILLGLVLSVARMKYVGGDEMPTVVPTRRGARMEHSFPFLESLNEVLETNRNEESQTHVHRMYFMGPNTFSEPWHLPHSPPEQVKEIVYEDAFNRFVDEINGLAAYQWWEGSIYSILAIIAYPLAWSWLQLCRKKKLQLLREYVRSEYDHSCLRSCRSRALYEGIKVAVTPDLMLAYVDFFLGGDEKRDDLPPRLHQRFPMSILFGGDGSYTAPFTLHSDNILTSLMSQAVPPTIWYRLIAGLNAQLRLVRRGHLKSGFGLIINWLETHANPTLSSYGVRIDLAWFQPTTSSRCQFGVVVYAIEKDGLVSINEDEDRPLESESQPCLNGVYNRNAMDYSRINEHPWTNKRMCGGILNAENLQTFKFKRVICYPFSFLVNNTKPIGHQDLVGLVISVLLLGDVSLVLLTLLQLYSISVVAFVLVLSILPLGILCPFPAGITALFSHGPRQAAGPARVYALWNIASLINVGVAFICGYINSKMHSTKKHPNFQSWNFSMDESEWWVLPSALVLCKVVQARLIDYHVANQEIQDPSVYSKDPDVFWQS
ncbi:hypothetical protein ACFE04_013183 [Oxalis oulophora]